MLQSIDHVVLLTPDLSAAQTAYADVFGASPVWRARDGAAGTETALFDAGGTGLELLAPRGEGSGASRVRELIGEGEGMVASLAFKTADIEATTRSLARRGLAPGDITEGESTDLETGAVRRWRRVRCSDEATAGTKIFVLQYTEDKCARPSPPHGGITALDHLVIETPNPDRAAALYGARLELRLALDRTAEQWKTRFLFFRIGSVTLEVIHRLGHDYDPSAPDKIWGVTWETDDLEAAHARLTEAGRNISDIRTGRKPGSRVFTLRDRTSGVPTLFIAHEKR
ncbi:MAG: VOC family protein [Pseudomonadota bacterium]